MHAEGSPESTACPRSLVNEGLPQGPAWATALREEGIEVQKGKTQCSQTSVFPASFRHGQQHSHLLVREKVLFPFQLTASTPPPHFTATLFSQQLGHSA